MGDKEQEKEPVSMSDIVGALAGIPELAGKEVDFSMKEELYSPELAPYVRQILEILEHPEAFVTDETMVEHFTNLPILPKGEREKERQETLEKLSKNLGFQVKEGDLLLEIAKRMRMKFIGK